MRSCLYITYMCTPDNSILQKLVLGSSKKTQIKISNTPLLINKWRHLLTDLLIRKVLSQELNMRFNSIKINTNNFGKPELVNKKREFNISHSNNIIVLATDDLPVGVDVEYIQPLNDLEELIMQFTQEEQDEYYKRSTNERINLFYELWTLKESYLKATGKGLNCSLQSFNIRATEDKVILSSGIDSDAAWYFQRYMFNEQYKCALCSRHQEFPREALSIEAHDLLNLKPAPES
jgi:4'-phosphopantetheinyl transferase